MRVIKLNAWTRHYVNLSVSVLVALICSEGISQNRISDSLRVLLPDKVGIEKVDVLYELAYELVDIDNQSALFYATHAFVAAGDSGDSLRMVKTGRLKSLAFRRLNYLDSSLELSLKIVPIARKFSLTGELKSILNGLGKVYTEQGRYDKALEAYLESLELRKVDGDKFDLSVAMNNIGIVYYKLHDFDNALTYFNNAIELRRHANRKYDYASILINAALTHANRNEFGKASTLLEEALNFCENDCAKNILAQASLTAGIIALRQNNYFVAENEFLQSLKLATEAGDERFQLDNLINLSHIYIHQGKVLDAENYLQRATERIRVAGTSYNREIMEVYMQLALLYEQLKNYKKVAHYLGRYVDVHDSIYSEEMAGSLMKVQAQHLEKEKQIELKAQNELLALNDKIILRQRYLTLAIGIVVLLLILLALILTRSNKQKEKLNYLLDKKVRERTEALELNQAVLRRACEERDLILNRVMAEIKGMIATMKGLCCLARKDSTAVDLYMDEVDFTSERFLRLIERINSPGQITKS